MLLLQSEERRLKRREMQPKLRMKSLAAVRRSGGAQAQQRSPRLELPEAMQTQFQPRFVVAARRRARDRCRCRCCHRGLAARLPLESGCGRLQEARSEERR